MSGLGWKEKLNKDCSIRLFLTAVTPRIMQILAEQLYLRHVEGISVPPYQCHLKQAEQVTSVQLLCLIGELCLAFSASFACSANIHSFWSDY